MGFLRLHLIILRIIKSYVNGSYKSSYEHNFIFAVKVPDENNTCFEIKEYSLGKDKEFNYPIYYSIKRTGHFEQISFDEVDSSLNYFGINELSNHCLTKEILLNLNII